MKTTGVSCVTKFRLLVFLGHPNVYDHFMLIDHKFSNKMKHDKIVLHLFNERNLYSKRGEYIELAKLQCPSQAWYNLSIGRCVEAGEDDWLALGVLRTTWQCDGKAKVMGKHSIQIFHLSKFSRAGYQRWKKQRKLNFNFRSSRSPWKVWGTHGLLQGFQTIIRPAEARKYY